MRHANHFNPFTMHIRHRFPLLISLATAAALAACGQTGDGESRAGVAKRKSEQSYARAQIVDISRIRFDDGDTFYIDGKPLRVLGIDTPETRSPSVGIDYDQPYGPVAAESTATWMRRARKIEVVLDGKGLYGRQLGHVFLDGELLAVKLLREGLAYENVTHFGDNGFPDLADEILEAARTGPTPKFIEPYKWKRKHQRRRNK